MSLLCFSLTDFLFLSLLYSLGIEGLITFKRENKFDPEAYAITVPGDKAKGQSDVTIAVFDKVRVRISVEKDKNTQRGKVMMNLVSPVDSRAL